MMQKSPLVLLNCGCKGYDGDHAAVAQCPLHAAAPDLLAALERLMDLDYHCDYSDEAEPAVCPGDPPEVTEPCHWCEARAAIARATSPQAR